MVVVEKPTLFPRVICGSRDDFNLKNSFIIQKDDEVRDKSFYHHKYVLDCFVILFEYRTDLRAELYQK